MAPQNMNTVLMADDEIEIQNVVRRFLDRYGYELVTASNGKDAISKARTRQPSIVLLDVNMPGMDGFTVCQKLREDPVTRMTPILMLTARTTLEDKVTGLGTGADDYLCKPFDLPELKARIETLLRRNQNMMSANPLTHLPGGPCIQDEIESRIKSGQKFGVAYIDIDNFKAYNDVYGYHQGDEVIKWTSRLLQDAMDQWSEKEAKLVRMRHFLGHIGGDDFILIANSDAMKWLCDSVAQNFDADRNQWYNLWHRVRGSIQSKDRQGNVHEFPLMTLSIAVSTNDKRNLTHYGQIAQITSELKKFAKGRAQKEKSLVVFDRRTW